MAPIKQQPQQDEEEIGEQHLLAFLENALAGLELAAGGQEDAESRAKLEELRAALGQGAGLRQRNAQQQGAPMDELAMAALLDNMDQQLGSLEAALSNLGNDEAATGLLQQAMGAWLGNDEADKQTDSADKVNGFDHSKPDSQSNDAIDNPGIAVEQSSTEDVAAT